MSDITEQQNVEKAKLTEQSKVISLFQFIKELNKLKQKAILNISEYPWYCAISKFPNDLENISVFYRDRVENENADIGTTLLSVHKPEFLKCPDPDKILFDWLEPGWDSFHKEAKVKEFLLLDKKNISIDLVDTVNDKQISDSEEAPAENFRDNEERVQAFDNWIVKRNDWVEQQKITEQTRNLFTDLYRLYFELQRDSESMEMIVANGILCDRDNPAIRHPVLTHRVKLNYDADKNTVYIEELDVQSELYDIIFQTMGNNNLGAVNQLREDLRINDYHPLDRNDTPSFLKAMVHQLSSDSIFSEEGIPDNWSINNRLLLYMAPCYIVRKRLDGTLKAIEQIIEDIQKTGWIPSPISDIVSGGKIDIPEDTDKETIEEQLAAVGGESIDILLSKEANKEQLEIARRIEYYNAVLVQGPPGTGKTHTIANLMGHFLAKGKSVLVTSQTPKALSVLKEKVVPGLQNLCVSVLDDSNVDMEKSIDGITDYMSKTTSYEIKREMDTIAIQRKQIINELSSVRRNIFSIINQECNCIVYNGENISPSKAAAFVLNHTEDLSYIPGKVRADSPLPLTFAELADLYSSNEELSEQDEAELADDIPSPDLLLTPAEFEHTWEALQSAQRQLKTITVDTGWKISNFVDGHQIEFEGKFGTFVIDYPDAESVQELKDYTTSFGKFEKWMKYAAVDGKNGGSYRQRWMTLIDQIKKTCNYGESVISEQFGLDISFVNSVDMTSLCQVFEKARDIFVQRGKISKITFLMHKDLDVALDSVKINGKRVQSASECEIILHCIEQHEIRKQCAVYWDELLSVRDVPKFFDLDKCEQERIAYNWIPHIQRYLDWYQTDYDMLQDKLSAVGIPADLIFSVDTIDSDIAATDKILFSVENIIPYICDACGTVLKIEDYIDKISANKNVLQSGRRMSSQICNEVMRAIADGNTSAYYETYANLEQMYAKYALQTKRKEMLKTLESIAPQWVNAICNREGIHGKSAVPSTIEDAWKWKQLSSIIEEIISKPFCEFQADSIRLSKEYKETTALYAEKSAWYHLLKKTEGDIDMKHALQGWKLTVKRIGKGTGKNAPALKAKARELMGKCQDAVPGWIMPINRALENLNPKENSFDIVIIDEASQSDISSLAILYMGNKLIIVGDDKQVSPMAIGVEVDKMNALEQMYIKDKIPNSHLYNAKTSIYDIASTTFQPLMLREHFRCVPEIIGFSNMLSYDYNIKPLRDASDSKLLPAVINYRVGDGERLYNKTNPKEASAIIALMQACIEQPEYSGKSFGVISMLGDEQVKLIQRMIEAKIIPKEIIRRNILCGNASNFQGDERDVVFLSVVDSGSENGPIKLMGFGTDDAYKKRYNVAASRARDQLWVVDSLDAANDLKPGDIRKLLIDYSNNPEAFENKKAEIEENAESPFELAVSKTLVNRGYHLVQQWKVGAYRLDIVAVYGRKTVAIECDGERYHSDEAKIREDMERQTILERLGWRFIRIRGSEYYHNPEKTMERVVQELSRYGIEPEECIEVGEVPRNTELLGKIKARAATILYSEDITDMNMIDIDTIAAALNPKSIVSGNVSEVKKLVSKTEMVVESRQFKTEPITYSQPKVEQKKHQAETEIVKPIVTVEPQLGNTTQSSRRQESRHVPNKHMNDIKPVQQVIQGMEDMMSNAIDVISIIKKAGVDFVDKRDNGGALWIIGGKELVPLVEECHTLGVVFKYKPGGGRATKGKDGWWAKNGDCISLRGRNEVTF